MASMLHGVGAFFCIHYFDRNNGCKFDIGYSAVGYSAVPQHMFPILTLKKFVILKAH